MNWVHGLKNVFEGMWQLFTPLGAPYGFNQYESVTKKYKYKFDEKDSETLKKAFDEIHKDFDKIGKDMERIFVEVDRMIYKKQHEKDI